MRAFLKIIISFLLLASIHASLLAEDDLLKGILPSKEIEYIIRLENGDIIGGYVIELFNDPVEGEGIKFRTEIGDAKIFANQILEIALMDKHYRHQHRIYLQPTADPIGKDLFVGVFEMLFLYAGGGISDWLSITLGHSFIPGISVGQQLTDVNVKLSYLNLEFEGVPKRLSLAVGGNMAFINSGNRLVHYYGVATLELTKTILNGIVFYKAGSRDFYFLYFGGNKIDLTYPDGSFGIGLGLDTKISRHHDLHIIGEIWNSDVTKPTNSGVLLGVRICNSSLSADFGISFFTQPFLAPFMSFAWTPF